MKYFIGVLSVLWSFSALAQVPNASFENGTESNIENWVLDGGKAGSFSSFTFPITSGDTTVKAKEGDKFAKIEEKSSISCHFKHNHRNSIFTARFLYLPTSNASRFSVEINLYNRENDTTKLLAHKEDKINPFISDEERDYDWFFLEFDLTDDYILDGVPDSCEIIIKSDAISSEESSTLLLDDFTFSTDTVPAGLKKSVHQNGFSIFPNPSNGPVFIENGNMPSQMTFFDLQGRLILRPIQLAPMERHEIDLPEGLFIIRSINKDGVRSERILIQH